MPFQNEDQKFSTNFQTKKLTSYLLGKYTMLTLLFSVNDVLTKKFCPNCFFVLS